MAKRLRIRLVAWLQQLWQHQSTRLLELSSEWQQLASRWESLHRARQRCLLAVKHGLMLSLPELQQDLIHALGNLSEQIATLRTCTEVAHRDDHSFRHWFEEVDQLYDEFSSVTFQPDASTLRVETPVIKLRDICLGAFAIDFKKKGSAVSMQCFEVVALQPEPASTDSEVVHPHVKDGELCAGDAKAPLTAAMASGRLVDAFLLIQSTLQTYNSRSAYVKLEQWYGVSCSDCSRTMSPDDSYSCLECDHRLCNQCTSSCSTCSSTYCPECIRSCASCNGSCCEACLEPSDRTGKLLCRDCRTSCDHCGKLVGTDEVDEEDVCPDCIDREEEPLNKASDEGPTA